MNSAKALDVWLVDDDASIRWVLERALRQAGMHTTSFEEAESALAALGRAEPDVLVTDIRMPGRSGLDLLEEIRASRPKLPVIVMTAHSDLESAVAAYQGGAFEYLPKPFDIDQAVELVRRAAAQSHRSAASAVDSRRIPEMLGHAAAMQEVFRAIGRLSRSSMTVLITGESGTGKELVARALHRHSPRAAKPFIALNTSAFTADLLESELFGHEKGAFTGATELRRGRFEQADGGTLFLDEVGDMSQSTQAKILRVLQEHEFERLGGTRTLRVDVRIIAATNRNLTQMVQEGRFREDLFYRLNVVSVEMPPLRDRKDDIAALGEFFVRRFTSELKKRVDGIDTEAQKVLMRHNWPGNIRELENVIERAVLLAEGTQIGTADLQIGEHSSPSSSSERALAVKIPPTGIPLEEIERQAVVEALRMSNWVQKDAAELLSISPRVMNYKIKILNIEIPRSRRVLAETIAS